ncbi:MAG: hypothetical protein FK731_06850 [Asgard group archaeon]|nr:hypothetical protein [Asgard group archaeon]
MTTDVYHHLSILAAHIAKKIVEDEGIDIYFKSPADIAVVCHNKKYIRTGQFDKMMSHLSEYGYFERRGAVYLIADQWKRVLPAKLTSIDELKELGVHQANILQEYLAKYFIDVIKNDIQKIEISKLIYQLDTIDGSKKLHNMRSDAISLIDSINTSGKILDINFGLGYSAIQLAMLHQNCKVYSIQMNTALREAYNYTIQRNDIRNLKVDSNYPSEMLNSLMKDKVDYIFVFNPLGLPFPDLKRYMMIANQVAKKETKIIIQIPLTNQPKNTLLAEWLAECIYGIDGFQTIEHYKIALNNSNFDYNSKLSTKEFIIAGFHQDD